MALQGRDDKHLRALPPHSYGNQLEGECLASSGGAKQDHVGIFIGAAIEDINDDQTVIVLIDAQ